ncbi:uncharacterized protein [Excalfactoria chinensis]|uniref:uncharacterized protein n=1 Tax=Excalfactoria chinensis TaxID=46218 RepID=UPI003B3B6C88
MGASCGRAAPSRGLPRAPRQRRSLPAAPPAPNPAPRRAPRERGAGGGGRRGSGPTERTWGAALPGPDGAARGLERFLAPSGVPWGRGSVRSAASPRVCSEQAGLCLRNVTGLRPTWAVSAVARVSRAARRKGAGRFHTMTPCGPAACGEPMAALGWGETEAGGRHSAAGACGQRADAVGAQPHTGAPHGSGAAHAAEIPRGSTACPRRPRGRGLATRKTSTEPGPQPAAPPASPRCSILPWAPGFVLARRCSEEALRRGRSGALPGTIQESFVGS